jgi:hypothetical protein
LVGTLALAVNPLYFVLALTFMTEVPSLALSMVALGLLARGMVSGARPALIIGAATLVAALLVRQTAVAVAVGAGVAWLATRPRSPWNALAAAAIPLGALAVVVGYEAVIYRTIGLPPVYGHPYDPITEAGAADFPGIVRVAAERLATVLIYLALFSFPLSLVVAGARWRLLTATARLSTVAAGVVLVSVAAVLLAGRTIQPYGNFIYDLGVGPPLLRDRYLLGLQHLPTAPQAAWIGITLLGVLGLGLLIWLAVVALVGRLAAGRSPTARPIVLASFVTALAYLGFLVVAGFLDRYILLLVPLVLALVAAASPSGVLPRRGWLASAAFALAGSAIFGVAAGHDYFAWNRSRWAAIDYLVGTLDVSPSRIDGGYEFNGWYGYDPTYRERPGVSWWWVQNDDYLVTFGPVEGFREIARFGYTRWLPPGDGSILVLQRQDVAAAGQ